MSLLKKILPAALLLLATLFVLLAYLLAQIGSGYSAKYLCSQVFLAGREPRQVIDLEIDPTHPMFALVSNEVDREARTVRSVTLGLFSPTTAVYREGFGCTLAVETTPAELRAQAEGVRQPAATAIKAPWPGGSRPERDASSYDFARIDAAIAKTFTEPFGPHKRQTQAVAVVHRGRLIAEAYAAGFDAHTPVLGWSMTKTVTGALAGILVGDGKLDVKAPAPVPEWAGEPEKAKITLDDLLHMSSGLDFSEKYAPFQDAPEMLYASGDMAAFAARKPLRHAPGTVWYYSSGDTNIVARMIRMQAGGTARSVRDFARRRLLDPLGMRTAVIEPDSSGTFVGSSYMYASAQDWARFGLFLLNDGVWNGQRILPAGWVAYMRTAVPSSGGIYGAQTWLNQGRDDPNVKAKRRYERLPKNLFYLNGYNGQSVMIVPDEELIVVRLGVTHKDEHYLQQDLVVDLLEAISK